MAKYNYDGPVLIFGVCVADHWKGTTIAVSENKARSNLTYQYKKKNNQLPGTKVELPGAITLVS